MHFRENRIFIDLFGQEVYAVGGFVRDQIRGDPSEDVDILITHHTVDEIIEKLESYGKVDVVGKSFGVIKFTVEGKTYDIALPRKDRPKRAKIRKHKDFTILTDPNLPLEKDLERRDFRCNSIAVRLSDGKIIDPFKGQDDIRDKVLKLTNPLAFPDDPLRVLRAARFASVLDFSVDPGIYEIAKGIDLSGISEERIKEELFKLMLLSAQPSFGLNELLKLDALRQLFPELYRLTLCLQDSVFHPEKDAFGHHTVWAHTLITVDQAKRLTEQFRLDEQKSLTLLLAALFHDVGKPDTTQWEYKRGRMVITSNGHDIASAKVAKKTLSRLKIFSWNNCNLRKMVPSLIKCHHRASELWQNRNVVTKKAFNRLAADVDGEIELLVYLDAADRAGRKRKPVQSLDREGRWLLEKFEELNVSKETIQPLIMGRDLIKMGVSPGPLMGKYLKKLYQMQLDNEFDSKEKGLIFAKKIIKEGHP
ncbi:MAG: HD domain-containing protein [Candidatus Aminicenantes bacterium]|nr:MAG: HD domain-containing protein [Candidatus Aminicenantes bacterium]